MSSEPVVGIIGGMGPDATVELMRRVLAATPAHDDADHIHMMVDNNPKVPSRIRALIDNDGENPGPVLAAMARRLESAGADFLVIPCNTAHYYWEYAQEAVQIPVWHLVDLTLAAISANSDNASRVGLLASPALRRIALYEPWCTKYQLDLLYPDNENELLEIIKIVKSRSITQVTIKQFNRIALKLADKGVDSLILGCTEFSLIAEHLEVNIPVFDTLQLLAQEIVKSVKEK